MKVQRLLIILLLLSVLIGCGPTPNYKKSSNESIEATQGTGMSKDSMAPEQSNGIEGAQIRSEQDKIVYRSHILMRTKEFDKTVSEVRKIIVENKGFIETSSINNDNKYERTANFTLRIPSNNKDIFSKKLREYGEILSENLEAENLTEQYRDMALRYDTLKTKRDRLIELLKKAEKLNDVITIENAISQTEYEMDSIQSNINRIDKDVTYSTITLQINEIFADKLEKPTEKDGYIGKVVYTLKKSLYDLKEITIALTLVLIYFIPFILIIGLIIVIFKYIFRVNIIDKIKEFIKKL